MSRPSAMQQNGRNKETGKSKPNKEEKKKLLQIKTKKKKKKKILLQQLPIKRIKVYKKKKKTNSYFPNQNAQNSLTVVVLAVISPKLLAVKIGQI